MDVFKAYLSVYSFPFFQKDAAHKGLCEHVLTDENAYNLVRSSMRVLVPTPLGNKAQKQQLYDSLKFRIPVYFGKPCLDMFSDAKLKKVAGYTSADALKRVNYEIRYAICGRVLATSSTVKTPKYAFMFACVGGQFRISQHV